MVFIVQVVTTLQNNGTPRNKERKLCKLTLRKVHFNDVTGYRFLLNVSLI